MVDFPTRFFMAGDYAWQDAWCFWWNMVPLGLSALVRAMFWSLGIPISVWKQTWVIARWEDDFLTILPASSKQSVSNEALNSPSLMTSIVSELKSRKAHHFPHAGARRFTEHVIGEVLLSTFRFPILF